MDTGNNFNEVVLSIYKEEGKEKAESFLIQRGRNGQEAKEYLESLTNPISEKLEEEIKETDPIKETEDSIKETSENESFLEDSSVPLPVSVEGKVENKEGLKINESKENIETINDNN